MTRLLYTTGVLMLLSAAQDAETDTGAVDEDLLLVLDSMEDDPWDEHERGLDVPETLRDPMHPRPDVDVTLEELEHETEDDEMATEEGAEVSTATPPEPEVELLHGYAPAPGEAPREDEPQPDDAAPVPESAADDEPESADDGEPESADDDEPDDEGNMRRMMRELRETPNKRKDVPDPADLVQAPSLQVTVNDEPRRRAGEPEKRYKYDWCDTDGCSITFTTQTRSALELWPTDYSSSTEYLSITINGKTTKCDPGVDSGSAWFNCGIYGPGDIKVVATSPVGCCKKDGHVVYIRKVEHGPVLTILSGGNDGNAKNLQACTGECDSDAQCAAGLKCFQRQHGEPIPGCKGAGGGQDWDYCYDPNVKETEHCWDYRKECVEWAKAGECTKNPAYMLDGCAASCDACATHNCKNKRTDCAIRAANGECGRNSDWMAENCPAACRLCGSYTLIMMADIEGWYRGHHKEQAQRVVKAVRDIGSRGLKFDNGMKIEKPALVVHAGDNNADCYRSCSKWPHVVAKHPEDDFKEWWDILYDAGIPMISNFGNHDWGELRESVNRLVCPGDKLENCGQSRRYVGDGIKCHIFTGGEIKNMRTDWGEFPRDKRSESNRKAVRFVRKTFEKARATGGELKFWRYNEPEKSGQPSADMYRAEFRGLQIAMMMESAHQTYEDKNNRNNAFEDETTFNKMAASLDKSKHTLFVTHLPLYLQSCTEQKALVKLIRDFPDSATGGSAHMCGHVHIAGTYHENSIKSWIAPYPYTHREGEEGEERPKTTDPRKKAGVYAVNVHPTRGILEIKQVDLKKNCWADGTVCLAGTTCEWNCCDDANGYEHWYSKAAWACGYEPRWGRGTLCAAGTSCSRCKETATWWWGGSVIGMRCGVESKWGDGTYCLAGTSCKTCRNKATWWYGKHPNGYYCGTEPKWGDGTYCLAGTSCNNCRNKATWWYVHPHGMRCGREPCWKRGTRCYANTCGNCCGGANQPWYWFGGGQCK